MSESYMGKGSENSNAFGTQEHKRAIFCTSRNTRNKNCWIFGCLRSSHHAVTELNVLRIHNTNCVPMFQLGTQYVFQTQVFGIQCFAPICDTKKPPPHTPNNDTKTKIDPLVALWGWVDPYMHKVALMCYDSGPSPNIQKCQVQIY